MPHARLRGAGGQVEARDAAQAPRSHPGAETRRRRPRASRTAGRRARRAAGICRNPRPPALGGELVTGTGVRLPRREDAKATCSRRAGRFSTAPRQKSPIARTANSRISRGSDMRGPGHCGPPSRAKQVQWGVHEARSPAASGLEVRDAVSRVQCHRRRETRMLNAASPARSTYAERGRCRTRLHRDGAPRHIAADAPRQRRRASPLQHLEPGQWYEIPDSRTAQRCSPASRRCTCAKITAWSSASTRSADRSACWYGAVGTSDYAGNEVYAFDLGTLEWTRLTDPSPPDRDRSDTYADGAPRSRHTYNYIEFLPAQRRLMSFGGASLYPHGWRRRPQDRGVRSGDAHVDQRTAQRSSGRRQHHRRACATRSCER